MKVANPASHKKEIEMENEIANLIAVGSAIVLLVHRFLNKRLALDVYKDRVFRIREDWFDLALDADSSLEFNQNTYRRFESILCSLLANAEHLSVIALLAVLTRQRDQVQSERASYGYLIHQIQDIYTREKAEALWRRMAFSMHNYFCARSVLYLIWTNVRILLQPVQADLVPDRLPILNSGKILRPS